MSRYFQKIEICQNWEIQKDPDVVLRTWERCQGGSVPGTEVVWIAGSEEVTLDTNEVG